MRRSRRRVIEPTARTTTPKRDRRSESGDTLVEVLLAVIVLGMASVALLIAFGTSISASADHRQLSASGVVLDSVSQQVISEIQANPSLFDCPEVYQNYVNDVTFTAPSNYTVSFAASNPIEYWNTATESFGTTCEAGEPQQITITITDLTDHLTFSNSFVVDSPLDDNPTGSGSGGSYGAAAQLVFTTQPVGGSTGEQLQTQPVVTVEDSSGNTVANDLSPVLLTLSGPGVVANPNAALTGCAGTETEGVVTFTGCTVNIAGAYTITATDGNLSGSWTSSAFTVSASADYLVFSTQPAAGASGAAMTTEPVVQAWANGALDTHWTGTITLTPSGGSLTNCSAIAVTSGMNGTATFTSCKFSGGYYYNPISEVYLATPYTLTASATNSVATSPVTSTAFGVTGPGTASSLVFSTQPSGAAGLIAETPFATQPVVTVEDSFGNIVNASSAPVTLAISSGTLTCAVNPLAASGGYASFTGCFGSGDGNGLTLTASSTGLSSTTSASFNITGLPTQLIFTTQPVAGVSGAAFTTQPVITVEDSGGNTVTASSTAISLTASGGSLQLCTNLTPYEGVVSVATCNFAGIVGTSYYLTATQGLLSATSGVFTPTAAGTPTQLVFTTEPVAGLAGSGFTTQPTISVEDSAGNITTSDAVITLTPSGGSLLSCPAISAVEGVAEFSSCAFGGLDTQPYTLSATSPGLSNAISTNFTPSGPGTASASVSTFTASPAIVVDNGTTSTSMTATLEDAYTNPIPGKTIAITQGATGAVITAVSATTNSSGVATFTATDTNREIVTFTATDSTDGVAISEQPQVSFATQLTLTTGITLGYGTTSGSLTVSFTAPSNAPVGQTYTALACTNSAMTTGCVGPAPVTSGGQITGLAWVQGSAGTPYYVTITAQASTGYLFSTSNDVGPQNATSQVNAPTNVAATASATATGALTVTFTASTGTAPSSYSATACTNAGMTSGCVGPSAITSGGQITGLTPGTGYYVEVTANPPAGYVSATSTAVGPTITTVQLSVPSGVTLAYGPTSGTITVNFAAPTNAPGGQTYTALACTNAGMTTACVGPEAITSGGQITGLAATQGSAGTAYYVTITAVASPGYLASTSTEVGPQGATSQVNAPTVVTTASSTTTAGAITATFTASTGVAPSSYSATACTNVGMTTGCVTQNGYTSGSQFTGLVAGTSYYVTITANPPTGFVSATSTEGGPSPATIQLNAPTGVTLAVGTTNGSLTVTFTASSNAAAGQTYSDLACTNSGMTTGCVGPATVVSGGQITGLTAGTAYYVVVAANASPGYLVSLASAVAGPRGATVQLAVPTGVTLAYGPTTGTITVTFTAPTNAPGAQTYTALACTNAGMTTACVGPQAITSGSQITGLTWAQGSAGTSYYVTITAVASTGYLASTSPEVGPQAATSQVSAPTGLTTAPSTTTAGAITATFTASSGTAPSSYTANVCTNAGMTTGCTTDAGYTSGAQITGLTGGTTYYVTITANPPTGYLSATTAVSAGAVATRQLAAPTGVTLSNGSLAGGITVTFTASSGAPGGQIYVATACTNSGMTTGCVGPSTITSGGQITGLTGGTGYYVTVQASASSGYLASTQSTPAAGPETATTQLAAATGVTLGYGTVSGSISVTFTAPTNAPGGQTYTALACTNAGMTTACVGPQAITSGGQITGLVATQGSPGTAYYVTITAVASTGYLASTSTEVGPQNATSQVKAPTGVTVLSSTTTGGAVTVTFTASTGTAPSSYTAIACTNSGMTTACVTQTGYTSGAQFTGLTGGTPYYVTLTAVPPTGYLSATTIEAGPANATLALAAPSNVTLAYGLTGGSLTVTFTAPTGAPGTQTYTSLACQNAGMTTNCVGPAAIVTGGQITGLAFTPGTVGTGYYVTITAVASTGYLASTSTEVGPQNDMSQVEAPTGLTTAPSTTTAGAITATFTASGGTAPTSYTAEACTNNGMTTGCVTQTGYTSGAQLTGLTAGTSYYVEITAVPPAGYASNFVGPSAATKATLQIGVPGTPTLTNGTTSGSVTVTFTASTNAAAGQIYTGLLCTNSGMTTGCVGPTTVASGGQFTGLTAGTSYYATVTASASSGYLASGASGVSAAELATTQLNAPTVTAVNGSGFQSLSVTFTASSNAPGGQSYTAMACTNAAMTAACVTETGYTSGTTFNVTHNGIYYVTVTAVTSNGYLAATSSPVYGPTTQ
jgi:trimeric autotransporter adhesin